MEAPSLQLHEEEIVDTANTQFEVVEAASEIVELIRLAQKASRRVQWMSHGAVYDRAFDICVRLHAAREEAEKFCQDLGASLGNHPPPSK